MKVTKHACRIIAAAALLFPAAALYSLPAGAQAKDPRADFITALDEGNIRSFLSEVGDISTGRRPDLLDEDVANYFENHVADKGSFKSVITYNIPGYPANSAELNLEKEDYINLVINGRYMMETYSAAIELRDLKIGGGGKTASFTSIITEKGKMPVPKDQSKPDVVEMIPIEGVSTCAQKLIVSFNNFIQMAGADCTTTINFDPFGNKPLVAR